MESNLNKTVKKLNDYFFKMETGAMLDDVELKEQRTLRDELINYFKFAITKHVNNKEKMKKM